MAIKDAIKFRVLTADEIEVRVGSCSKKGATFLLYKDARCDMAILDETVGPENWNRKHSENKGNLFCQVYINRNYKDASLPADWAYKEDCGAESFTEKQKGEASDSFKRACVNWGIGRELYTKIHIFVPGITVWNDQKKRYELSDIYEKFIVSRIQIDEKRRKITELVLSDEEGTVAFAWSENDPPRKKENFFVRNLKTKIKIQGRDLKKMQEYYGVKKLSDLSLEQYINCCNLLDEKPNKAQS